MKKENHQRRLFVGPARDLQRRPSVLLRALVILMMPGSSTTLAQSSPEASVSSAREELQVSGLGGVVKSVDQLLVGEAHSMDGRHPFSPRSRHAIMKVQLFS